MAVTTEQLTAYLDGELAVSGGGFRQPVASCGPGILFLAPDPKPLVLAIGRLTHCALVEGTEETVVLHHIHHLDVADSGTPTQLAHHMGCIGHRLHPTGHDEFGVSQSDGLIRQPYCGHARQAHLVDRQ
jgi:hypothetical protein